ncbi:hypothetical protein BC832DRAFT_206543 [Gaertneriomyces semiglobifer]|nr:hypothetical protein BC832DRAFT_206543 [Gaertneriomyces semiglobifer]
MRSTLFLMLVSSAGVAASSTPRVCTFVSLSDCNSYSGPNCMGIDQLPSGIGGTCAQNDPPRLFLSSDKVCSTYPECSATTQAISSGDPLTIEGQAYEVSAGITLAQCPDDGCTHVLSEGTSSGKLKVGTSIQTLTATALTGVSYAVVGTDAYVTSDDGATFYKSTSNPPSLGILTDPGKEILASTATQSVASYNYAPINTDNFARDANTCNEAIRFVQGSFSTYAGLSILVWRGSDQWLVSSNDCPAALLNMSGSYRYIQPFRVFIDSSNNAIAYLSASGDLYEMTVGGWTLVTNTAGCLANGRTYFKTPDTYTVYNSGNCLLDTTSTLTGTPVYDFTFGPLTLFATADDISAETCLESGTTYYKLSGSVATPTLNLFSSPSCAPNPTVDATTILGDLTASCDSLNAGDYAISGNELVRVVSSSFACASPDCIDIGDCQTDSCLYQDGQMGGKVSCSAAGGIVKGMVYVYVDDEVEGDDDGDDEDEDPPTLKSSSKLSGGKIAAAAVTPVVGISAAVGATFYMKAVKAKTVKVNINKEGKSIKEAKEEGKNPEQPGKTTEPVAELIVQIP